VPRSSKPRKAYRPRLRDYDPVSLAINRAALLTDQERHDTFTPVRQALSALRQAKGSADCWRCLVNALHIAEALMEQRIGNNLANDIDAALCHLAALQMRVQAGRGWTLYAHELASIDYAVDAYGAQLQVCSTGEQLQAIERVRRRTRAALTLPAGTSRPDGASITTTLTD
jgi:hypothetical protein